MQKGDIIYLDYEGWIADKKELFDTTKEETAKKENKYNKNAKYKPIPIIVGVGRLIKGLDDHILQAEVDKEYEIEILPQDAYGDRDPSKVKIYSIRELKRKEIVPEIGKEITIDDKVGTIVGGGAGRVRVDFNPQLSGKKLFYKYKITKKVEEIKERIETIIEMHYGERTGFEVSTEGNETTIKLADRCKYEPSWFYTKYRIVNDLRDYVDMKKIRFIEEYVKKEEEKILKIAEEEETKEEVKEEKKEETKQAEEKKELPNEK